jgi:hypothetical protein
LATFAQTKIFMTNKKFKLNKNNNTPFETGTNAHENETHALIRIVRSRHCKSLNVVLIDKENNTSKSLTAKPYNQVDLVNYEKFTLEANFVSDPEAFVEGEVYTGSWEEMVLVEAELSFSDSPFYISCSNDQVEFTIGAATETHMEVKPGADGGFSVSTTIVHPPEQALSTQNFIADNTAASQVIKRLYGRMKGRINGQGFEQRQEEHKQKYAENFHQTILEGFHPVD